MVDAVTLDFGGSPLADFSMPDASGLVPLSLPEAVLKGNQKPLQQPSPEAVRRFQEAMKAPVSPMTIEPLRSVAEQKSVVVETVVKHEAIVDGGEVETLDTPRVSRPVPQTPSTPQRETTHVVAEASSAATRIAGAVETPVAQATPFVDKPAMPTASVAAPVVEVPVRPVAASVAAPVVNEPVKPVAAPVALPAVEEPVPTPIAAETPRKAAEPQGVVVETVVRHETIDESGEVETIDMSRVSRPVPQMPFTLQRETTHVVTEASPAATQVVGVVVTPAAQATPVVDKPVMPAAPVAVPVVEVPVRPVVVPDAAPVATPVADEPVRPVAAPIAAPAVENPVATPIAAETPRRAAEPQSVVVETVVRHETIGTPRVSRPVPQTPFTPSREMTHVVTEASSAAAKLAEVVATPAAQATPVFDRPAMPATSVAVPVVEEPVRPVAEPVAAPVSDAPVTPVAVPVVAPIAEEPVITPIAAETPRRAAEPQSVVVETVVRHETIDESGEVEMIETSRASRPVPQTPFTLQRETTHVVTEASSAAAKLAGAVATPVAQATPVFDRPAMPATPVAVPVVEVPVTPVAVPVATPVFDEPVRPVAASIAVPVVEVPVTPVPVPFAAPIAKEPVIMPVAPDAPRRAAESQSVVVETVVRQETKADGGEVETIDTPRVSRPVPQTPSTPKRETTHVVTEASPTATQVDGAVAMPAAQATPVVDRLAMPATPVAVPVVEVPVTSVAVPVEVPVAAPNATPVFDRPAMPATPVAVPVVEVPVTPVAVPVAAPVVDESITPVAVPVAALIAEEPVITPIAAESPRRAAKPQSVVVETVVRHETKADGGEVETIETTQVSRSVPPSSFTPQRETTHVVTDAPPAATQVVGAVATPVAQATPVFDRPAMTATPVAVPVVEVPVTSVAVPVEVPVAAPIATPVVDKPVMPTAPVAVSVVEVPVRPVVASVAAPVSDVPVTPVAVPVATPVVDKPAIQVAPDAAPVVNNPIRPVAVPVVAPIAEEPVITPVAPDALRKAAEPQSVVVETVVRHETKADGREVETIETSRVSRPVPPSSFAPQRETTHVVIEASPAATQVAGAVATPAAQATPAVDKPAIPAAPISAPVVNEPVTPVAIPIAAPVVNEPVTPVAIPIAAPVADMPVTPVAAPVAAPVVDKPVTPVAVPVAAPIAEEPVITPVAAESPRKATEPQSVVVETVVRHETIAEGGEVEKMAAPRVQRPVPQTSYTPSREATHVVAKTPDEQEPVLQAAPVVAAPPEYLAASAPLREDGISVAAATARTEAIVETVNKMVEAVVGQISVTPSLVKGEGEVHMTLKPTILDGSDITLTAKDGTLTVAITPATPEAAQSAAAALPRLEAALAEHVAAFHHVSVALVAKKGKTDETA